MQADNRLLDDLARVASGAFGALTGVRGEVEDVFKRRLERILADMDLVPRDEFDAVKAMAAKARQEQEALERRVAVLEAALAAERRTTPAATPAATQVAPTPAEAAAESKPRVPKTERTPKPD